jgi:NADH-quinone oxidoreductase subunit M
MNKRIGMIVWFAVCLSFISRIPVWPFHYWISSVTSSIKNPLVYIIVNIMPLIGIYGFVRFWPLSVPESVEILVPIIETFAIITMIFVALIAFANQQFLYKIFSYTTIYYLLFLLAVILPTDILKMNIAYSSFIFLIVTSSLIILDYDLWEKCKKENCEYGNILPHTPKLAATFAFFALIAMGLPISSLFWSNFVLVSEIFVQNFIVGVMVMTALTMAAIVLMDELLKMFSTPETYSNKFEVSDISRSKFAYLISVITILLLSFFNPLWFVF